MNIVKITQDSLILSSGISQESFARTNMAGLISKKSSILHYENGNFSNSEYSFDSTVTDENGNAVFIGKPFGKVTLSDILLKKSEKKSHNDKFALFAFAKSIDYLIEKCPLLSATGAGGIIVEADSISKKADFLFIQDEFFEECAQNQKGSYPLLQGKYIYKGLSPKCSLLFLKGVVCYKALTGSFPFDEDDTTRRQEDIFDSNFIEPKVLNKKLGEKLSKSIKFSLMVRPNEKISMGKRSFTDSSAEKKNERAIREASLFDADEFYSALENAKNENESEKSELISKKRKFILAKRFFRKNKLKIALSAILFFAAASGTHDYIKHTASLATTKGLTSQETSALMYSMIHKMDIQNLEEVIKGRKMKDYLFKITGFYVSSKQRLQMNPDNSTLIPERWFFGRDIEKIWMQGITNLKIDGKSYPTDINFSQKKDKPEPVKKENEKALTKGQISKHTADYYFIMQGEKSISVEKMHDTLTLTWDGSKWNVTSIESLTESSSVESKEFIEDFKKDSIKSGIDFLRQKYEWIPSERDIKKAAENLVKEYDLESAKEYIAARGF